MAGVVHDFVGEGRRCEVCGNLDYEHEEKWREKAEEALELTAFLVNDEIGGNGIHWAYRIEDLVRMLEELGYDMNMARDEMEADE